MLCRCSWTQSPGERARSMTTGTCLPPSRSRCALALPPESNCPAWPQRCQSFLYIQSSRFNYFCVNVLDSLSCLLNLALAAKLPSMSCTQPQQRPHTTMRGCAL